VFRERGGSAARDGRGGAGPPKMFLTCSRNGATIRPPSPTRGTPAAWDCGDRGRGAEPGPEAAPQAACVDGVAVCHWRRPVWVRPT
jgi:hypothetical protein